MTRSKANPAETQGSSSQVLPTPAEMVAATSPWWNPEVPTATLHPVHFAYMSTPFISSLTEYHLGTDRKSVV